MRIKIHYTKPHPWRPQWPIPRHRLVYFGLVLIGSVSGLVGSVEYEAGDHRFRALQLGGIALVLVGHLVFFRMEWKRKPNLPTEPTLPGGSAQLSQSTKIP
jgi:hypothetical protein